MDVYQIVTDKIISLLEQGTIPWRRPWTSTGLPRNLISKKAYKGINYFLLSATKFVSPYWMTMRQANLLGGHVRKGEVSTMIVYWRIDTLPEDSDEDRNNATTAESKSRKRILLRYYHIWNLEQCDLLESEMAKLPKLETYQHNPIEAAERIIANMPNPPEIHHGGTKAFYLPSTDRITLPPCEMFTSAEEYYATVLHELLHSSGNRKRLAREGICEIAPFGAPLYSLEEMISEMGAAYLCALAGISPAVLDNQAAYVQGWLKKIRGDRKFIIRAAAQAQKAADYILNVRPNE